MEPIFELEQKIKVVHDTLGDYFLGSEGIIKDIFYKEQEDEIVYGVVITKAGDGLTMYKEDAVYYFLDNELALVEEGE